MIERGIKIMTDDEMREIIKNRLIKCRTDKGITQKELSDILGKSMNAIGSWEQGLSLPSITTLYRLSLYYETLEYFYGESEK